MHRWMLLLYGLLSSLVYAGADLAAGLSCEGYDFYPRAVSALGAIGAPTRPLLLVLFTVYFLLLLVFGLAVAASRRERHY